MGPLAAMAIGAAATGAFRYIPGRDERALNRYNRQELERVQQGRGGLTTEQRQRELAILQGQINAQQNSQLAQLARGAGTGVAGDGRAQQQQRNIYRLAQQAGVAAQGQVRVQDLALAEQRRQQALQGMRASAQAEYMRRTATLDAMKKYSLQSEYNSGQGFSVSQGVQGQQAADQIKTSL